MRFKKDVPLPLLRCEALEAEYVAVHGPLPDDYQSRKQAIVKEVEASSKDPQPKNRAERIDAALLPYLHALIHRDSSRRSALCLSGGGMRSATFSLGVLQGLARAGVLETFDYLSTVSGGGYIGSWLSAWIKRFPAARYEDRLRGVMKQLAHSQKSKLDPEPPEIHHLREFSNFVTPKVGLFSADSWTFLAIYLRNLAMNWLILLPLLAGALVLPRLGLAIIQQSPAPFWSTLALILGSAGAVLSSAYIAACQPGVIEQLQDRGTFWRRQLGQEGFRRWCLLPLSIAGLCFSTWWAWNPSAAPFRDFVLLGISLNLCGWIPAFLVLRRFRLRLFIGAALSGVAGGVFAWLMTRFSWFPNPRGEGLDQVLYVCFAGPLVLGIFLLASVAFVGFTSRLQGLGFDEEHREWQARFMAWMLIVIVGWAALCNLVLFGPWAALEVPKALTAIGGFSGIVAFLIGRSSRTPATPDQASWVGKGSLLMNHAASILGGVFIMLLVVGLSLCDSWLIWWTSIERQPQGAAGQFHPFEKSTYWDSLTASDLVSALMVMLGLMVCGWLASYAINLNKFSLHAAYRNRLIRAFLGASADRDQRRPNPFTGFDPQDDLPMHELRRGWNPTGTKLFPVVNVTLNLVSGDNLAWQQRKAESFTVTPLHAGSSRLAYRSSEQFGGRRGIFLGTAAAISGAAVSSNMGHYTSSPLLALVLTLFNMRLGWWLGNPKHDQSWKRSCPKLAVVPIIREALGLTHDRGKYVYLSDGGHFENLGLYEMVLRRCRRIVVCDAGQDAKHQFSDLGAAIRKIRVDLGIPIEFKAMPALPGAGGNGQGTYFAMGRVRYSCVDSTWKALMKGEGDRPANGQDSKELDGDIILIKAGLRGDEPRDVLEYASVHPSFPHESTGDQSYSESQFESYRALGSHIIETAKIPHGTDLVGAIEKILSEGSGH